MNIDHIATLRQARYAGQIEAHNAEPNVLVAAEICERAGAGGITAHLRADRRHIQDADIFRMRESLITKLNLEMGNTPEILAIALRVEPEEVCLVPENRKEITTEGGLDVAGQFKQLEPTIKRLQGAGVVVSLFIEPEADQIEAAIKLKADAIELHTGAFANAQGAEQKEELDRLIVAAKFAHQHGLIVNAGHGINYTNIAKILKVPHLHELNIGHSIVARSVFTGLEQAVRDMLAAMAPYQAA
ncbi:MAG: pyridoxine 5'-phosphate synthase [Chthoniobacteraceae bacterium]